MMVEVQQVSCLFMSSTVYTTVYTSSMELRTKGSKVKYAAQVLTAMRLV